VAERASDDETASSSLCHVETSSTRRYNGAMNRGRIPVRQYTDIGIQKRRTHRGNYASDATTMVRRERAQRERKQERCGKNENSLIGGGG